MNNVGGIRPNPFGQAYRPAVPVKPLAQSVPVYFGNQLQGPQQNGPNGKPPRKRPPWIWFIAPLAMLGIMQMNNGDRTSVDQPYTYQEPPVSEQQEPPRTYPGPDGTSQIEIPPIALEQRNLIRNVDEALALSRGGHLMPKGELMNYRGMVVYHFQLRTGKDIYLPVPETEAENQRLKDGLAAEDNPYNVELSLEPLEQGGGVGAVLLSFLPTLLFIGLMIFLFRRMMGGGGMKPPGLSQDDNNPVLQPKTRFKDIGGYPEVVKQLEEVLEYIHYVRQKPTAGAAGQEGSKTANRIQKLKENSNWPDPPKGILLTGPPGTGKTFMAKAIAGEAGVPLITKSGSDFVELYVGNGARRVKALFAQARKLAAAHGACIVFIDEIDALGKARSGMGGVSGGNDEREQTLNALLVELDGFDKEGQNNIIVMGATNQAGVLDPALVRSGRFDMKIEIPAPVTPQQRKEILEKHCIAKGLEPMDGEDVDLMEIAHLTPGMVGADLEGIVKEAKRLRWQEVKEAGEGESNQVSIRHFRDAIQNVSMGPKRDYDLPEKERRTIAVHEVLGHGLVGEAVGISPLVISMIARNQSLGHVIPDPQAMSKILPTFEDKLKELLLTMGGQAAETVVNGQHQITPGAAMDYKQARNLVKTMLNTGMFRGFNVSDYMYANQDLTKEDRVFMNDVLENALQTAIDIIEQVPEDKRMELVAASITAGELQGEDAINFYKNILGEDFDWTPMLKLAETFVSDPTGQAAAKKAS